MVKLSVKISLILTLALIFAQYSKAGDNGDRQGNFYYGGYLGIRMGEINHYDISPTAGYFITPRISIAAAGKYQFYRDKRLFSRFDSHIYGFGVTADYFIIEDLNKVLPFRVHGGLFLQAETEFLHLEREHFGPDAGENMEGRFWHPIFLGGAGLRYEGDEGHFFNFLFLFELSHSDVSLYHTPAFRIGFFF